METLRNHFDKLSETIRSTFGPNNPEPGHAAREAYDDISEALDLSFCAVALLVWSMGNMGDDEAGYDKVASQIGFSNDEVSSAIEELERRHYMVKVNERDDCVDLTDSTKEMVISHYCFYRLLQNLQINSKRKTLMLYHNEESYERDCNAFARFNAHTGQTVSSECLRICPIISDVLAQGSLGTAYQLGRTIQLRLRVELDVAVILAILVTKGGFIHSLEKITELTGFCGHILDDILSGMFESGLINQLNDSESIILTEKAIRMLQKEDTFENILQTDFIGILSLEADSDDPFDADTMVKITDRLEQFVSDYPESRMGQFYEENHMSDLSVEEFCGFVFLCRHFVLQFTEGIKMDRKAASFKALLKRGWATLYAAPGDSENDLIKQNNMLLSVNVCKKLFAGLESIIDFSSIMGQTRLLKWNEIEEKPLFYNQEETEKVQRLKGMVQEDEFQRIKSSLREHHLKMAVSAILYGGPGTGKTELAKQIARSTRRNLLLVDASKLTGSYIGESERNYRDLFRNFRYIEAVSSQAPIMFIDEADGILGQRIPDPGSSRDRYMNTIQNIILEELSDFEGILIVTTNLSSNLDEAMDRRFLMKIEFHAPDEETRKRIWKSKLPQVAENDLSVIARDYPLSGGHIDNIATQAIIESIMDGSNTVTLDALKKFSEDETSFSNKDTRKRIGF